MTADERRRAASIRSILDNADRWDKMGKPVAAAQARALVSRIIEKGKGTA